MAPRCDDVSLLTVGKYLAYFALFTSVIGLTRAQNEPDILRYDIDEESGADQVVGRVFVDAGLESDPEISESGYLAFTNSGGSVSSIFAISEGRVLTTGPRVDRDILCPGQETCVINVDLQVQPSKFFRIIKVQVTINDINDNAPQFPQPVISRSISEAAAIGSKIPLPSADDPDSPAFGIDHYSINGSGVVFDLDYSTRPSKFLVLKQRLDREETDVVHILLTATDKGSPAKSSSTVLDIQVVDVNDNLPQFDNDTYYAIIPEDFPVQLPVLAVHASDRDVGDNAAIVYGFDAMTEERYGQYFSVDSTLGIIRVKSPLDFEAIPSATLTVTATNGEDTSMSSFTNVFINIGDINDNPPEIHVEGLSIDNVIYKEETDVLQDFVAYVTVSDPDSGDNGKFECDLSSREFSLDKMYDTDYVIQNNVALDREQRVEYDVRLTCTDKGIPRRSSVVDLKIQVMDVNDNAPAFTDRTYYATVVENNFVGSPVLRVRATDPDNGVNGTVTYSFGNAVSTLLNIDVLTGNITTLTSFDREQIPRLEVLLVASDQGTPESLSSTTTLVVDIIDQDDNKPAFTEAEYTFHVNEGQSIQTLVGQVTANDPDSDLYRQFGYYINYDGGDSESFTIDRDNGKIYTGRVLLREVQSRYTFQVRTVSDGPFLKADTATVIINLHDINNMDPVITYPNPMNNSVYLSNKVAKGTAIAHVKAYDLDEGSNAELSYFIVTGDNDGYFDVEPEGSVTVQRSLEEFDQRAFGLVIMVTDSGSPPRSTEAYLNVVVNKSLADSSSGLISRQNLTIVIAIATVSGLVMVALIVAIVTLMRWPRLRSVAAKKYNYVARVHSQKHNNPQQAYDNHGVDVEKNADFLDNEGTPTKEDLHKQQRPQPDHKSPGPDEQLHDGFPYPLNNIKRNKGRDSECSSASSAAETDSGRGSHEEIVLDQSASRIHTDRHRENSPDFRHTDFPLLSSLQGDHLRRSIGPGTSRDWHGTQGPSQNHHHSQYQPQYQHGSRDALPLDAHQSRDHPAYQWQSSTSHMSNEVHV